MKILLKYLLIILFCASCNNKNEKLKFDSSKIAILNYNLNDEYAKFVFSEGENSKLTNEDLIKIELTLDKIIAKQNIVQKEIFKQFSENFPEKKYKLESFIINKSKYDRQYIAIMNKNGEKEVWVNMCDDEIIKFEKIDWKNNILKSSGGGSHFFNFKINITQNKFYEVWFNAEA